MSAARQFCCLSENGRGLAHFAMPCEQNVPVPLFADRFRKGCYEFLSMDAQATPELKAALARMIPAPSKRGTPPAADTNHAELRRDGYTGPAARARSKTTDQVRKQDVISFPSEKKGTAETLKPPRSIGLIIANGGLQCKDFTNGFLVDRDSVAGASPRPCFCTQQPSRIARRSLVATMPTATSRVRRSARVHHEPKPTSPVCFTSDSSE